MNRRLYRLVFNAARGQIMAVAEVAVSHAGDSDAAGTTPGPRQHAAGAGWMAKARSFARSTITSVCALLMALPPGQMARAQVAADPQAAASLRPQILSTANGTTQVNIQAPSAAGVSRNVYSQFDVDNRGVILNNTTAATQTQIGGWVQANGNLSGGSARVILNEVNATAPSQLRGFVEVAGQRAEVVIANPAGIAVNGGGFINASAVTLTTGTPILNSGNLEGYRVTGGQIQINGAGFDASGADYARILARAVQVNAGLWSQNLKVVTGAHQANADASVITPITPDAGTTPAYALDVAALGGMYAGKITLIGTEAGLGVNNAGVMAANSDLVLQSDGQLINRGVLDAQNTRVRTSELHNLGTGRIYGDHVALQTQVLNNTPETVNGVTSAPVIAARERLDIGVGSLVNGLDALLLSGGDMAIGGTLDAQHRASGSAQSILNAGGTIEALGSLHASADSIRNTNPGFAYEIRSDGSVDGKEFITSSGIYTAEQVAWILAENTFGGAGPGGGYRYSSGQGRLLPAGHTYADKKYQPYYNGANAFVAEHYENSGYDYEGNPISTLVGDSFAYSNSDPIWGLLGLSAPTGTAPGPRPRASSSCDEYACTYYNPSAAEMAAWQTAAAPWVTLQSRLDAFRASVNASAITFTAFRNFSQDIPVAVVTASTPGQILSGGHMTLHAGTELLNEQSRIMAGGTLAITGQSLNNQGLDITAQALRSGRAYAWSNFNHGCGNVKGCDYNYDAYRDNNYSVYVPKALSLNSASSQSGTTPGSAGLGAAGSLPTSSLFHTAPNLQAHYLIETDPLFTSYRTWLSSDYMLSALALDPALTQKRLGDGYYEQRLVREQVAQLTGRRFLDEYSSDEQQYQALMNAGITYAQAHSLRPGIALSADQMAALTQDLVWLVEQTVTLPDGSTATALVPRLYTVARNDDLDGNGALLSARSLDIQLQGQFSSGGRIAALENARISANDIQLASSGATDLQADRITLQATQNINLVGSQVEAGNSMNLQSGRDIQLTTTSSSGTSADGQHNLTQIDRVASLSVTDANGTLQATAGRDVQLTGAVVKSAGSASLQAGNNLVLNAVRTESSNFYQHGDTMLRDTMHQDVGSRVNATGNVDLLAMNSITGTAASVASEGQTRMIAGDTISLVEGRDERSYDQQWKTASYDFFARTETSTKIQDQRSTALLGQVSGTEGVTMQAGSAIQLSGQQLAAELGEIQLGAPQIVLASALNLVNHSESTETKTIGISTGVLTGTFQPGQGMFYQVNLDQANSQTSLAATTLTAQDITLSTTGNGNTGGGITLAAVELRATGNQSQSRGGTSSDGRITLDAGDGSVNFATVQTTEVASISRKASDIAWQAASGSGRQDETAQHTRIEGELTLNAAQIKVQGTASSLEQAAKALAQQPGLEWLGQLQSDPALAAKVDWQKINEAHKDWQYNQQGLTPAGAAIITLIVALFTAGAGTAAASSVGTAGTAGAAGAAGSAAATATVATGATWAGAYGAAMTAAQGVLMSQAAITMINTGGNIGDTLKQMSSKDSVRNLITAMVTAGAINALGNTINYSGSGGNIPPGQLGTVQTANDFTGNLLKNITNNLASATIDAAINGKPLNSETLADSLKSALITAGMAQGANSIGNARVSGDIDNFTTKVAHAILGCAGGVALGSDCSVGAVGSVVGEMAAEFYNPTADRNLSAQTVAFAKLMAGVAGAITSGDGSDSQAVNNAAMLGGNAAENNWLGDHQKAAMAKEMREAQSTLDKIKVSGKYLAISGKQDILTGTGIGIGLAEAGWSDVQGLAEFLRDPIAGLAGLKQLISNPDIQQALGDQIFSTLDQKIVNMQNALITGGDDAAIDLGKNLGTLIWQVGSVVGGTVGVAKGSTELAKIGVKITERNLENISLQIMKFDAGAIHSFRSADEINSLMQSTGNWDPAWKSGTNVAETTIKPGTKVQMVVSSSDYKRIIEGEARFGGWATFDEVPNQAYARKQLAITPSMKTDVNYVVEVEVTKPINAHVGIVGRQAGTIGADGGGNQLHFLVPPESRGNVFKVLSGKPLP